LATNDEKQAKQQSYPELHDIPRATIGEIKNQILRSWRFNQHRGVFCIVGEAGMGKSQIIHQIATQENARVVDIRTSHFNMLSAGVPSVHDEDRSRFKVKVLDSFPREGEKAILAFDELNQGAPHAIAMFFSLIEDRKLYDYVLPRETLVVAMMNPDTGAYAVSRIENNAALRRRLKMVYAIPSYGDWLKHAKTKWFHYTDRDCSVIPSEGLPCHPYILDFFVASPNSLDDHAARMNNKQYTCPATIQTISLDAYIMDKENIPLISDEASVRFSASIGETMTAQLTAYLKDNAVMISPKDVLLDFKKVARKVKHLVDNNIAERLIDLDLNVLQLLFTEQPPVETVAPNLLDFMVVHPNENNQSMISQVKKLAQDNNAKDYLKSLMREFHKYKEWVDINVRIDKGFNSVANDLSTSAKKK
jgi:hypothetical protein